MHTLALARALDCRKYYKMHVNGQPSKRQRWVLSFFVIVICTGADVLSHVDRRSCQGLSVF